MKKILSFALSIIVILVGVRCTQLTGQNQEGSSSQTTPLEIGSRLELFIDDYLINNLKGEARLLMHHPQPKEIVIVHNAPWEGSGSGYHSIFHDGDKYRMYYKSWQHEASSDLSTSHPIFCAYAESEDGITWKKPDLGLYEFNGSKKNNIVFISGDMKGASADGGHPAVFLDENPNAPSDARYKALLPGKKTRGLIPFKSSDGIHWSPMSTTPVITDGAFDSQNLAFWDGDRNEYRAYWRYFSKDAEGVGTRAIRTAVSQDFLHWTEQKNIEYVDSPDEQLYTNQIKPYHRAPHLLIGFPARYIDRGWSASMKALPELDEREKRSSKSPRYGTALTESLLMVSRDGELFKRWNEAFLRPGLERKGTWTYGDQYLGWHIVETKSSYDSEAPNELSLYSTESYWKGKGSALRRYTLRLDGFVSVNAPMSGGELITKPFTFTGKNLNLNFSSSAAGGIQVEIQDETGKPLPGFSLEECDVLFGDTIERMVSWKKGSDLSSLAGKPIRLRIVLKDADLFSLRFQ